MTTHTELLVPVVCFLMNYIHTAVIVMSCMLCSGVLQCPHNVSNLKAFSVSYNEADSSRVTPTFCIWLTFKTTYMTAVGHVVWLDQWHFRLEKQKNDAPVHTFYYGNRFNENLTMFNRSHTVQRISFNTQRLNWKIQAIKIINKYRNAY